MDALPQELGSPAFIRQHYISRSVKLYAILLVFVALGVAYYGIEKYLEYSDKNTVVAQSDAFVSQLEKDNKKEADAYTAAQVLYKDTDASMNKELASVFPLEEDYTSLTKEFDDYFFSYNKKKGNDPVVVTDIQYGSPTSDASAKYDILPISMNITASENGFYDFLRFVQSSGTLSKKLRLLDLKSIQLNFNSDDTGSAKSTIQFRANLSAYFQKTKK